LEGYLERAWVPSLRLKEEDEKAFKKAALEQMAAYLRGSKNLFTKIESAEQHFTFHMEDSLISGKIDLIRKATGKNKEIVDFKTSDSKSGWKEQIELQMSMYALGAEESLGLQVERCSVHFLKDDKVASTDWDGGKKTAAAEYLKNLLREIKLQRFAPRREYCPFCGEFKDICPYYEGEQ
jgi:CRISPR/Cas system-associated exonuclease Cas4 (RecB family)